MKNFENFCLLPRPYFLEEKIFEISTKETCALNPISSHLAPSPPVWVPCLVTSGNIIKTKRTTTTVFCFEYFKNEKYGSSLGGSAETNLISIHEDVGSMTSLSGLWNWHCRELWYRSQTQLRSGFIVTMALAGNSSSN